MTKQESHRCSGSDRARNGSNTEGGTQDNTCTSGHTDSHEHATKNTKYTKTHRKKQKRTLHILPPRTPTIGKQMSNRVSEIILKVLLPERRRLALHQGDVTGERTSGPARRASGEPFFQKHGLNKYEVFPLFLHVSPPSATLSQKLDVEPPSSPLQFNIRKKVDLVI